MAAVRGLAESLARRRIGPIPAEPTDGTLARGLKEIVHSAAVEKLARQLEEEIGAPLMATGLKVEAGRRTGRDKGNATRRERRQADIGRVVAAASKLRRHLSRAAMARQIAAALHLNVHTVRKYLREGLPKRES